MDGPRKSTLKDIARQANLSVAAVSQILNNKPENYSSPETKALVKQIACELNYRQRFKDKLVRGDYTKTIGLLICARNLMEEEHNIRLVNEITHLANDEGYDIYWRFAFPETESNVRLVTELLERGVEHFILFGTATGMAQVVYEIERHRCTFLAIGSAASRRSVYSDSRRGAELVFEYIKAAGIRHFKALLDLRGSRAEAFRHVFPDYEPEQYLCNLAPCDWDDPRPLDTFAQLGYRQTRELLREAPETEAIFYSNDYIAIGGARYLHEIGRHIGDDILLFGFNNIFAVRNSVVPISSVEHATDKIARWAVANFRGTESIELKVPPQFILRRT